MKKKFKKQTQYVAPQLPAGMTQEQFEMRKKIFFDPVKSKEALKNFLKVFFDIRFPDHVVDEESSMSPMEFIWQVYQTALTNEGPKTYTVAAARNAGKTLSASILHMLMMIHFRRTCVHIASVRSQSSQCMQYMDKFCRLPEVAPYFVADNVNERRLQGLPPNWFTKKDDALIAVAVATPRGVNSKRANFFVKDELDLTPRAIVAEAAGMLDPTLDEHNFAPISVGLSSRKSNDGPLQDDMDLADADAAAGLPCRIKVAKFSMVDWMKQCTTHGDPIGHLHISMDDLSILWGDDAIERVQESDRARYKAYPCYQNCRTCPAVVACLGRAAKQVNTSNRLRDIDFVSKVLLEVRDPVVIAAQYLNWKPESTGNVYRLFAPHRHVGSLRKVFEWITGAKAPDGFHVTTEILAKHLRSRGFEFQWGIDWGDTQASCVVTAYHPTLNKCVVLRVLAESGYSNSHWAAYCKRSIPRYMFPDIICPDTEDANSHTYFNGFGAHVRREKPKRILTGVSQVRGLLWDPLVQTHRIMFVSDEADEGYVGMQTCIKQMTHWRHKRTPIGTWNFKAFEDFDDHTLDPLRYNLDPYNKARTTMVQAKEDTSKRDVKIDPEYDEMVRNAINQTFMDNGAPFEVFSSRQDPINAIGDDLPKPKKRLFIL